MLNEELYTKQLDQEFCKFCKKDIMVPNSSPVHPDVIPKITGTLFQNLDDDGNYIFMGWLCNQCEKILYKNGMIGWICGGGTAEAMPEKKYFETEKKEIFNMLGIKRLKFPEIQEQEGQSYQAYERWLARKIVK